MSGASSTSDFLGPRTEVLGTFQNTAENATDQGSTLDQGTWRVVGNTVPIDEAAGSQAGYTNAAAQAGYTICDEGRRDGPDLLITGTSVGAKWIHRLRRGSGSGTVHRAVYGKNTATTNPVVTVDTALGNFFRITE